MKSVKLVIGMFLVGLGGVLVPGVRIPAFAGPYRILTRRIDNRSEYYKSTGKLWMQLYATQVRGRQPMYVWGSSFSGIAVTDEMKVEVMLASRSNNQWKKNAFLIKLDRLCTNSKIYGRTILDVFYGKGNYTRCPMEPHSLKEIKNHTHEFEFPSVRVMPYGRYLFNLAVQLKNEVVGVAEADCDVVPKV